ncbi:Glycoprotein [Caenorhabditis elegans]|uniref:Glycoprotein n=1 Tax=Caenorhabditis elegans TaxID=6239 RepID=A0A2C9C336_CAEEL|nr:Glycoprotein [Caenorhabditis elegans]SOF58823.1 Glycoprotein [Caenorhabditis elegans]|eukprot:NP_001343825.1 Uncharacterized protein CELE_C35A11.3 [Caenorhabditis elegans]
MTSIHLLLLLTMCTPVAETNYQPSDPAPFDTFCTRETSTTTATESTTVSTPTTATSSTPELSSSNSPSTETTTCASPTTSTNGHLTSTTDGAATSPIKTETPKHQICFTPNQATFSRNSTLIQGTCITKPFTGYAMAIRRQDDLEERDYSKILTFKPIVFYEKANETGPHLYLENHRGLNVIFVFYNNKKNVVILDASQKNNCANDKADCLPFEYRDINAFIYHICWDRDTHADGNFIDALLEKMLS